jgi:hypothetical protein
MATAKPGLVLVFDLDQTLIDTHHDWRGIMESLQDESLTNEQFKEKIHEKIDPLLNMNLIEKVLRPASKLRRTGQVSAIMMLTNNTSVIFSANVSYAIQEQLNSVSRFHDSTKNRHYYFFDYIMIRTHPSRNGSANPPKSIKDVKTMLGRLELPVEDLERRTFFFDDIGDHAIRADFQKAGVEDHYINILPGNAADPESSGFTTGFADPTDYSSVEKALAEASAPSAPASAAGGAAAGAAALPPPCQGSSCSIQGGGTRKKRVRRTRRAYKKKSKANKKSRRRH